MISAMPMVHIVLTGLLVLAFFGAGAFNMVGNAKIKDDFARWGYPRWWRHVTGGLEIVSAAMIALPASRSAGLVLGALIIAGAFATILRRREPSHLPPLSLFAALLVLTAVTA